MRLHHCRERREKMFQYHPMDKQIKRCGRMLENQGLLFMAYSGSYLEFSEHTGAVDVWALGETPKEEKNQNAYLGVVKDGRLLKKMKVLDGLHRYHLCDGTEEGNGRIRLVKLTEEQYGAVGIQSVYTEKELENRKESKKKLLFIGDSITAGYGTDGKNGDAFRTENENVMKAYPWILAERFKADCQILAVSGSGVLSRWISPEEDCPFTEGLLPKVVSHSAYYLEKRRRLKDVPLWDERRFQPDAVILNLGTNDASYTRNITKREELFQDRYEDFLMSLSRSYPRAVLVCVYGMMEKSLTGRVEQPVASVRAQGIQAEFAELSLQDPTRNGMGVDCHPSGKTHIEAAQQLEHVLKPILEGKETKGMTEEKQNEQL